MVEIKNMLCWFVPRFRHQKKKKKCCGQHLQSQIYLCPRVGVQWPETMILSVSTEETVMFLSPLLVGKTLASAPSWAKSTWGLHCGMGADQQQGPLLGVRAQGGYSSPSSQAHMPIKANSLRLRKNANASPKSKEVVLGPKKGAGNKPSMFIISMGLAEPVDSTQSRANNLKGE